MALRSTAEAGEPRASRGMTPDSVLTRQAAAELFGTAALVFFGAGVATVTFGFRAFGSSVAAGVITTALAFGLVLAALVALIGPISGCHVNPAVTLGAYLTNRISIADAVAYWIAQLIGALVGALLLLWVMHASPFYFRSRIGLGANGYGSLSLLHISGGGAFLTEVIITAVFVMVYLSVTVKHANMAVAGGAIGITLAVMNLVAIPIDSASVNPARSFGPAIVGGGQALSQLWLFLIAPLIGAVLGTGLLMLLEPAAFAEVGGTWRLGQFRAQSAMSQSAADEGSRPAGVTSATTSQSAGATQPASRGASGSQRSTGPGDESGSAGESSPPGQVDPSGHGRPPGAGGRPGSGGPGLLARLARTGPGSATEPAGSGAGSWNTARATSWAVVATVRAR
jgi:aquaporin Z